MATSTLGSGTLVLAGTTSGTTTVTATAVAGTTTLTLPAATDTLVGRATTDTLTNKTLTGAAMNGTLGATTPSTVAATTLTTSSTVTHNGGTPNGVGYLDGSKVLTTGSALVFDGTNLNVTSGRVRAGGGSDEGTQLNLWTTGGGDGTIAAYQLAFNVGANSARTGAMFLTTSGNLGIGTTTPGSKLTVSNGTVTAVMNPYTPDGVCYLGTSSNHSLAFLTNGSERARIDTSGNLLVGHTAPGVTNTKSIIADLGADGYLIVNHSGTASGSGYQYFGYNGGIVGSITQNGTTSVNFNGYIVNPSDRKLKTNIVDAPSSLLLIDKIQIRSFNWVAEEKNQSYGVIAQELETVFPEAVNAPINEDGFYGVDYTKLVPMLVKAIQEQQALITQLTARITALEGA